MKKIIILVIMLVPSMVMLAQKPIKPDFRKADKDLREGKFDEAKAIIDAMVLNDEYMKDKKGNPSKNAAKTWYLRGMIYAGIDTTKVVAVKSLAENPLATAMESFQKCYEIDKGKSGSFTTDNTGFIPIGDTTVRIVYANHYFGRAYKFYKEDKDYKKAFAELEKTVAFLPKDTAQLMNAGVYFGPAADEFDKSIVYINRYFENGGKHPDAYLQLIFIYYNKKKDFVKTLELAKKGEELFPDNIEFPKFELNIYISEKKYDKAREVVQRGLVKNPNDKENLYLLGGLYSEMQNIDSAKIAYQRAVAVDNTYFDAQYELSVLVYLDAKKIKAERDKLGIKPDEIAKRKVLFDQLQAKYRVALPYWEKCLNLQPENEKVLYTLSEIYQALVMDEKAEVVRKKMKALGYLD